MTVRIKLFEKDFLVDKYSYKFIENYKGYPIYKSLEDGKFHCDTDSFTNSTESIDTIRNNIDIVLGTKHLFEDLEVYSLEASELNKEASIAIQKIVDKWSDKGYRVIEIETILNDVVDMVCSTARIKKSADVKTGKRAKRLKANRAIA